VKGANSGTRKDRLGNQIREVIAQVLLFEVKDPELTSVSVTDVELTGDLMTAKVFYYGFNLTDSERAARQRALERARGFLRRRIGQEIHARTTPDLVFMYDDSVERASTIEEAIRAARAHDATLTSELGAPEREGAEEGGVAASAEPPSPTRRRKGVYSQSAGEVLEGEGVGEEEEDDDDDDEYDDEYDDEEEEYDEEEGYDEDEDDLEGDKDA
jgi:ribosome-binding factor A